MKTSFFIAGLVLATAGSAGAAVSYVDVHSANPTPPYTSWATAAQVIQQAIDAATAGDEIVVTNGIYATGGRAVYGTMTNRVAVTKPLTLRSVNGPRFTVIQGHQVPDIINGDGAIRCAYLTNGVSLSGFTLTNGATLDGYLDEVSSGAGLWAASTQAQVSNCVLVGNSAYSMGGGAFRGTLINCDLIANGAWTGAGAVEATLYSCLLERNTARFDGGASGGTLYNCTLRSNTATGYYKAGGYGGGATGSTLYSCTLVSNAVAGAGTGSGGGAGYGGGAFGCVLHNCALIGNSAFDGYGGGASGGVVYNCTLFGNSAGIGGGGVSGATVYNCTVSGNSAERGGGSYDSSLNNCIVYYNTATDGGNFYQSQLFGGALNFCCTTPVPPSGIGNITNPPLFIDYPGANLRLQSNSPCINAGNNAYISGSADLDGNRRIAGGTVDIGAYEFQTPTTPISYAWLHQYGLLTDGSADNMDPDGDGLNNWQEWRCGTDPRNALSVLRMLPPVTGRANATVSYVTVTWQSVAGTSYFIERSTNLTSSAVFTPVITDWPGQPNTTTFMDITVGAGPFFYRVGVTTP